MQTVASTSTVIGQASRLVVIVGLGFALLVLYALTSLAQKR